MNISSAVFLMISAFAFVPLFIAEFARTDSVNTCSDFFLAGRKMKIFPLFSTIYATWMSAFAFMGAIGYFYEQGPVYMTTVGWDALFALLFYVLGRRIHYYGKEHGYSTPADFFHDIYRNRALDLIVTAVSLVFTMMYIEMQMVGGLFLIQSATDGRVSWRISGAVFFIVLVIYLWAGGLRAVAMTDVFYGTMIVITIFVSGIFLFRAGGGMENIFDQMTAMGSGRTSLAGPKSGERTALWLSLFVIIPVGAFMGPQMWIRCYAAKENRYFEALPFLLSLGAVVFIGTMMAGCASIVLSPGGGDTSMLFGKIIMEKASPVLAAFIFLGITAAIFSTANSMIHALSVVFTADVWKKYIRTNASDRSMVIVAKRTVVIISVLSYLMLAMTSRNLMNVGFYAMGGTAQLIIPVLGAFFWERSTSEGAVSGILAGLASFLVISVLFGIDTSIGAVLGLFINSCVFFVISSAEREHEVSERIREYRSNFLKNLKSDKNNTKGN